QRHKHLQFVPVPLVPGDQPVPIAPALDQGAVYGKIGFSPALPFVHAIARLDSHWPAAPEQAAQSTLELYLAMLAAVGLPVAGEGGQQPGPYNLLLPREWLWLVPRSQEEVDGVAVNALGFAGSLFVQDEAQLALLVEI